MELYEQYLIEKTEEDEEETSASNVSASEDSTNDDELESAEDMMSAKRNSPILNIYGTGKKFKISDNEDLFQIAKIIKDFTDRHFYSQNFKHGTNITHNSLEFKVIIEKEKTDYTNSFRLRGIIEYLIELVKMKFPDKYDISVNERVLAKNNKLITLSIKEK